MPISRTPAQNLGLCGGNANDTVRKRQKAALEKFICSDARSFRGPTAAESNLRHASENLCKRADRVGLEPVSAEQLNLLALQKR
jgi:hypothetical protein